MQTIEKTIVIPTAETVTKAKGKPAPKEGQGGKGNIVGTESKAQLRARYEKNGIALAEALRNLGASVTVQTHHKTGNFLAVRVRAELPLLIAHRNKLSGDAKKQASAVIDIAQSLGALADGGRYLTFLVRSSGRVGVDVGNQPTAGHKTK